MSNSRWLSSAILVGVVIAGSACTQEPVEATTVSPVVAADQRNAGTGVDKALEGPTTVEVIADTWITARVSARIVEETLLNGSEINVDTTDRAVTLKGTVRSDVAKRRAGAIAGATEGVSRVVNQIVVK